MSTNEDNLIGGRVTRARVRRLSVESESSSRPGTPVTAPKLAAINEVAGDSNNTPNARPVRMTRRNSTTAVHTPVNTPTKTPAKSRGGRATPDVTTPSKRGRRRVNSVTEEESTETTKVLIKTEFEPLPEEEETTAVTAPAGNTIKKESLSPGDQEMPTKRVTRASSKSPIEPSLDTDKVAKNKRSPQTSIGSRRGKPTNSTAKKLVTEKSDQDSDVEVVDHRSKLSNSNSKSIIEILDDTTDNVERTVSNGQKETIDLTDTVAGEEANLSKDGEKQQTEEQVAVSVSQIEKKLEANTSKDQESKEESVIEIEKNDSVNLETEKNAQLVEKQQQVEEVHSTAEQTKALFSEDDDTLNTKQTDSSLAEQQQLNSNDVNESVVQAMDADEEMPSQCLPKDNENSIDEEAVLSTPSKTASPLTRQSLHKTQIDESMNMTTPLQNKRNYSASHKSVAFNDSIASDTQKSIYPKTPAAISKTKSYNDNELDDSFVSSNATRNNTKDESDECIPETQEQQPATDLNPADEIESNANGKVIEKLVLPKVSDDNNTPIKNIKKLQSIDSSTPLANASGQMKKVCQELTPVPKADGMHDAAGKMSISSEERSLRSGRSYSSSPTSLFKKEASQNENDLEASKQQEVEDDKDNKKTVDDSAVEENKVELNESNEASSTTEADSKEVKEEAVKAASVEQETQAVVKETVYNEETWSEGVSSKGGNKESKIDVIHDKNQKEEEVVKAPADTQTNKKKKRLSKSLSIEQSAEHDEDEEEQDEENPDAESEELDIDEKPYKRHVFVDEEAMEVDDYESGDSMDEEEREEMEMNEIPVDGESLGSEDSDESLEGEDDEAESLDGFIASEGEDDDEEDLLDYSDDDEHIEVKPKKKKSFKRLVVQEDSTDNEMEKSEKLDELQETKATVTNVVVLENSKSNKKSKNASGLEENMANDDEGAAKTGDEKGEFSDDDASKLSESALKLCYTENTEESNDGVADDDNGKSHEVSRKELLKQINKSELFNKTIHEVNTEPSETSTELAEQSNEEVKSKRKSLNRSKIEAERDAKFSSSDDDNEEDQTQKRTSISGRRMSLRNTRNSNSMNASQTDDAAAASVEASATDGHEENPKRKTRHSLTLLETKNAMRLSLDANYLDKSGKISKRKTLHDTPEVHSKPVDVKRKSNSVGEPKQETEENQQENAEQAKQKNRRSSVNKIEKQDDGEAVKEMSLLEKMHKAEEQIKANRKLRKANMNKSSDQIYIQKKEKSQQLNATYASFGATEYADEVVDEILAEFSSAAGSDDENKEDNVVPKFSSAESDNAEEDELNEEGEENSKDNEEEHNEVNEKERNDEEKTASNSDEPDEEHKLLKKLDHIKPLFNPLSKARRQSLALPSATPEKQQGELTNKQLKRLKRQSLNVPSADNFNPSQSLIDTIAMHKKANDDSDSAQAQNAKRKRLSKSFNGIGSLDTTIEEARHLHKKSKIITKDSDNEMEHENDMNDDDHEQEQTVDDHHNQLSTNDGQLVEQRSAMLSSTPCQRKPNTKNDEINNNNDSHTKRIFAKCEEILEAANQAKLLAKRNNPKHLHKSKKQRKQVVSKAVHDAPSSTVEDTEIKLSPKKVAATHEENLPEKIDAVKKAVITATKLLNIENKQPAEKVVEIEQKEIKESENLTQDKPIKKKQQTPKSAFRQEEISPGQENKYAGKVPSNVLKSSAGIVIETPLTPKKPKKPIKTIKLRTGTMNVMPVTPKKLAVNGFHETDATPKTIGFKVRQIMHGGQDVPPQLTNINKAKKRKRHAIVAEPEYYLKKSKKWTQSGTFVEENLLPHEQQISYKVLAKHRSAGTEVMFANLQKHQNSGINVNALNFKLNKEHGNVYRQPSRELIRQKDRQAARNKF